VAGLSQPGEDNEKMQERLARFEIKDSFSYKGYPVTIYDVFGAKGIPLRTTVSEMGPQLFARVLDLNDVQTSLLTVAFKIADDNGLLLFDTKDVKALLNYVADNASDFEMDYGHIAKASVSTIIRSIVALESEGADQFFGEPAINISDFFSVNMNGQGMINILDAESLINKPKLYSSFMLYLLSELFEVLPEVGDLDKPKMVFFFDEAHLLFSSASKALLEKIEQVVKLIRSKGVAVFFVTQNPADIPDAVMAQLGNKIEHALRAYTPADQKALKAAADAFRENPDFDTVELLQNLGTGEAIVSLLDEKGIPTVSEHAYILPPESLMAAISDAQRDSLVKGSILYSKYANMVDSDSAYEFLERNKAQAQAQAEAEEEVETISGVKVAKKKERETELSKATKSVMKTTSGTIGREIGKTVGGALLGKTGKTIGGNIGASLGRNLMGTLIKK
ncbi:MAG: DUF853 family protein, partial [Mogibacterium sp.]|nr:DUF853 family protein [Mogibacterium sp.]